MSGEIKDGQPRSRGPAPQSDGPDKQNEETHTPRYKQKDEEWKHYKDDLDKKMLLARLSDAKARRDKQLLETVLYDWETDGREENREIREGRFILRVVEAKEEIYELKDIVKRNLAMEDIKKSEAEKAKDFKKLKQAIKKVDEDPSSPFRRELQQTVIEANGLIDKVQMSGKKKRELVLPMDRKTMSEIRRYMNPPKKVHRVLQAALLLMGFDEYTTDNWSKCMELLNPQGKTGMGRKVMDFDEAKIPQEIVGMAKFILTKEITDKKENRTLLELRQKYGKDLKGYVGRYGPEEEENAKDDEHVPSDESGDEDAPGQNPADKDERRKNYGIESGKNDVKSQGAKKKDPRQRSLEYREKNWTTNTLANVQSVSPAAATFYVWAMGIIQQFEKNKGEIPAEPVDKSKQRKIVAGTLTNEEKLKLSPLPRRRGKMDHVERYLQKETQERK